MPNIARLLAAVTAVSAASLSVIAPVSAAPAQSQPPQPHDIAVTLITGDVVHASQDEHGQWNLTTQPVSGTTPAQFLEFPQRHGGTVDQYVLPAAAMPLVQSGALDRELFDVTSLIRQGYDDAHSDVTPLLVASKPVSERKADAVAFWQSLTRSPQKIRLDAKPGTAVPEDQSAAGAQDFTVTFAMLDRQGKTPGADESASVVVIGLDTGKYYSVKSGGAIALPAGRYGVTGSVSRGSEVSEVAIPELRVDRDQHVTLDASKTKQVLVSTDQPTVRSGLWRSRVINRINKLGLFTYATDLDPRFEQLYVASQGPASDAFAYADTYSLEQPSLELWADHPQRFEVPTGWLIGSPQPVGTAKFDAVYGAEGTPEDLAKVDAKGKLVVLVLPGSTTVAEIDQRVQNVKNAGGVAVAVTPSVGRSAQAGALAVLPTFVVSGDNAQRLVAAAKAGGLAVSYTARTSSQYRYELSFPSEGRIPTNVVHKVGRADLAAVKTAYYGGDPQDPPTLTAWAEQLGTRIATGGWLLHGLAQAERVEYFTPGNWQLIEYEGGTLQADVALARGKSYSLSWNKAVSEPSLAGTVSDELGQNHARVWRNGTLLDVSLPVFADESGHPREWDSPFPADVATTSLYRDGQLLGTQNLAGRGVFVISPYDRAQYQLTTDDTRNQPWWPLSTKVSTTWTFRQSDNPVQPLLSVQLAPAVDLRDIAPGGVDFSIPVTVTRQDGPAVIKQLSVDVSYDDGTTWQPASVSGSTATVHHPASGFASLRVKAVDQDGNSVEQTVIRAYQIGGK